MTESIDRRTLLQIVLASMVPAAQGETCSNANHGSSDALPAYAPQFFTPAELQLLSHVMEGILPADDHSPGAAEAQVPLFADLIVATSPDDVKADWRRGLNLLSAELQQSEVNRWLADAAAAEHHPRTVLDLFFVKLKQMTVEGYYTSRIGIHQELGYQGNTYMKEFKGCTHAEHQTEAVALFSSPGCGSASSADQQAG